MEVMCFGCGGTTSVRPDGTYEPCQACGLQPEGSIDPACLPDAEPPTPAPVVELRHRWTGLEDRARRLRRGLPATVVEWRWADPFASPEPLGTERLWGRRTRWLARAPRRVGAAVAVGLDPRGRIACVGRSAVYEHGDREVLGFVFAATSDVLLSIERWTVEAGRLVGKVQIEDGPSWTLSDYRYDEAGRLVAIEEELWGDGECVMAMHVQMRSDVRYDDAGEVEEIVQHRYHDSSTVVAYRAQSDGPRLQRARLAETLRAGMIEALGRLRDGAEVRAVCLLYDTHGTGPPTLIADRTGRLDRDPRKLDLDDVSPLEWNARSEDHVDLATLVTWPSIGILDGDAGPQVLHAVLRKVLADLPAATVMAALGSTTAPPVFAMDTEREHAKVHVADAFGASAARALFR
jgi:hypothetical protein